MVPCGPPWERAFALDMKEDRDQHRPFPVQEAAMTTPTQPDQKEELCPGQIDSSRAADCAPGDRHAGENLDDRQEKLIDEAVEETYPASDPISPKRITK